jgi:hypothetical protein
MWNNLPQVLGKPLHKICVVSFSYISRSNRKKTQSWCWPLDRQHHEMWCWFFWSCCFKQAKSLKFYSCHTSFLHFHVPTFGRWIREISERSPVNCVLGIEQMSGHHGKQASRCSCLNSPSILDFSWLKVIHLFIHSTRSESTHPRTCSWSRKCFWNSHNRSANRTCSNYYYQDLQFNLWVPRIWATVVGGSVDQLVAQEIQGENKKKSAYIPFFLSLALLDVCTRPSET